MTYPKILSAEAPLQIEEKTFAIEMGFNQSNDVDSIVSPTFSDQMKEYESHGESEENLSTRNCRRL